MALIFRAEGPIGAGERLLVLSAFAKVREADAYHPAKVEVRDAATGEALFRRSGVAFGLGSVGRALTVAVRLGATDQVLPSAPAPRRDGTAPGGDVVRAVPDGEGGLDATVFPPGVAVEIGRLHHALRTPGGRRAKEAARLEIERLVGSYGETATLQVVLGHALTPQPGRSVRPVERVAAPGVSA